VIEQRLSSSPLPLQMRNLVIENGFVAFSVANEFEASLTLTGDGPAVSWRLLKLRVLVQGSILQSSVSADDFSANSIQKTTKIKQNKTNKKKT
jgi:hypothetical protein